MREKPVAQRFWKYVEKTPTCWEWTGTKTHGYGSIRRRRLSGLWTMALAHRLSYEIHKGPIPKGLLVRHTKECGNKGCVNPDHLNLGTQKDNLQVNRGEKNGGGGKLTEHDVCLIKLYLRSFSQRQLAKGFGVDQTMISRIKRGIAWRHVK